MCNVKAIVSIIKCVFFTTITDNIIQQDRKIVKIICIIIDSEKKIKMFFFPLSGQTIKKTFLRLPKSNMLLI